MILRRQLPACSPITPAALLASLFPSRSALQRVKARILAECGAAEVVLTSSGTVALALAFRAAAPVGGRPRVALPAWGCYDLMTAADAANAEVLLYDLDPATLAPDWPSFREALTRDAHAAVVAHWFGLPVDLRPFHRAARDAGALLIDDAAQAVGTALEGKPAGSGGDFGILSFGRGKGRTGGSGGALLATTREGARQFAGAEALLSDSNAGLTSLPLAAQYLLGRPWLYWIPAALPGTGLGETLYRAPPPLARMAPQAAAALERNWELSSQVVEVRRRNAARWEEMLGSHPELHGIVPDRSGSAGWLRYPVLATGAILRTLAGEPARRLGIMPGYPGPLGNLPVAPERFPFKPNAPGANHLAESLFTLPTHHRLLERDFVAVCSLFNQS